MATLEYNYPESKVKQLIFKLNSKEHNCNINILGKNVFDLMIEEGFNPESWEKLNNNNKILVNNIHYKKL